MGSVSRVVRGPRDQDDDDDDDDDEDEDEGDEDMASARTAKGTNSSKASNTSISVNGVAADAGVMLEVTVGGITTTDPTDVKYGKREMKLAKKRVDSTNGFGLWTYRTRVRKAKTKNVVATWASAFTTKVIGVVQWTEVSANDVDQSKLDASTGAPATGTAVTTTVADTSHSAWFLSNGPSSDTAGTAGAGHTLGQRVGTTGAPPASNLTLQETFEILTATGNCRATLSGATSRNWVNLIVAFKARQTYTITKVRQNHRERGEEPDWVFLEVEDENNVGFQVPIDPEEFDDMTDDEVTTRVKEFCQNYSDRLDSDSTKDEDGTRDTRMATFVNDTVKI